MTNAVIIEAEKRKYMVKFTLVIACSNNFVSHSFVKTHRNNFSLRLIVYMVVLANYCYIIYENLGL